MSSNSSSRPTLLSLDSLKGYPSQIPPAMSCLLSVQDRPIGSRWDELVDCLDDQLPELTTFGAKADNLISAQVLPTLRKIGLVYGKHESTRLSYEGRYLARIVNQEVKFRIGLAAMFLKRDRLRWHLVEAAKLARSYPGEATPMPQLALALAKLGVNPCQSFTILPGQVRLDLEDLGVQVDGKRSRLSQMIQFYDYVDILRRSRGAVTLLDSTLHRAREARSRMVRDGIRREEFLEVLLEVYRDLSQRFSSPYVPILPLREAVSDRLAVDREGFEALLKELVPAFGGHKFLLSPHAGSQPEWKTIQVGSSRYYYLSVYSAERGETDS